MADEQLPFDLERVVVGDVARLFLPGVEEIYALRHVGIPHRLGRVHPRLAETALQPGHRRAMRAVDLERHQVVAAHAHGPRTVDMRDHAALQLESGVGRIVGGGPVLPAVFVPAHGNVRRAHAADAFHLAKQVIEHVAPVAEHVENDAAAAFLAVVPARALRRLPVALEHPVAELAAQRQDFSKEARVAQLLQLQQAGQPQLVLHHAVLDAGFFCRAVKVECLGEPGRHRFLAINILARGDGSFQDGRPRLGRGCIEKQPVVLVRQRRVHVGGPAPDAVRLGQTLELVGAAADEHRIGHDARAVGQRYAALVAYCADRPDKVLVGAHASSHAVHDDSKPRFGHAFTLPEILSPRVHSIPKSLYMRRV